MATSIPVEVLLKLTDQVSPQAGGIIKSLGDINLSQLAIGGAVAAGVGALAKGLIDAAAAAREEEVGIAKLGAAVRATGADWGSASAAIEAYLAAELRRTALDDGEGREAISRLTTATGDYRQALELMGLAQDLAAAKGISLSSAAEIVGKVAQGNTGILSRYGITIQEGASATEALAAMQTAFAGQAEAYGNTAAGAQQKLDIALGNLKETIGSMVLPVMANLTVALADLAIDALPVLELAIEGAQPVFDAVFGFIRDTVVPILSDAVGWTVEHWPEIQDAMEPVLRNIWEASKSVFGWFRDDLVPAVRVAVDWISEHWPKLERIFVDPVRGAKETISGIISSIQTVINSIHIPHIPTPHVTIHWQDFPILGRIPTGASVDWYATGLNAIFTRPTLIGVGDAGAERVTVQPVSRRDAGSSGGTTYNLTYIDQRPGGGAPDLLRVARGLEWRARMGAA